MAHPDKFEIAQKLREIGALLSLKSENKFRAKAYDTAASALEGVPESLKHVIEKKTLTDYRGIGNSIAAVISEIYETSSSKMLTKLQEEYPPGIIELSAIPGLSVKKIEALHDALGISSIEDLRRACATGVIRTVKGFSEKSEKTISESIATYELRASQIRLVEAIGTADLLLNYMRDAHAVSDSQIVGAVSRWREVVESIDIVAAGKQPQKVLDVFAGFPYLIEIMARTESRCSAKLADGGLTVNLFACTPEQFVCVSHYRSGTDEYNEKLAIVAQSRGLTLEETGLKDGHVAVKIKSDSEIYKRLGLSYVPVEMREEAHVIDDMLDGTTYDDLIEIDDIRGMTHCHSTFSDGVASVEDMVRAVKKMKMEYMTLTDHSPTASYAGGVGLDRLPSQWKEIALAQEAVGIRVFRGTESDILADGSLDYPDDVLNQLDVIIASIHSRMKMDEDQMTTRLVNCMRQKQFKIWGHALGRLVLKRDPVSCRVEEVIDVASKSRVAIEVNGDPYRLDMEPRWLKVARKKNLRFVISTDAHSTRDLLNLKFGIHLARRAGMKRGEVLNTLSAEQFQHAVKPV